MDDFFPRAFAALIGPEGDYSAVREDPGNWTGGAVGHGLRRGTKYGISAASFPTLDIQGLTLEQARAIYRALYWDRMGCPPCRSR
jgi:lysozyme family protein